MRSCVELMMSGGGDSENSEKKRTNASKEVETPTKYVGIVAFHIPWRLGGGNGSEQEVEIPGGL